MPNVTFLPRQLAEELAYNDVLISIGDPGQEYVVNPIAPSVLRLEFDDVDQDLGPEYVMFDHRHALKILRFVEQHKEQDIYIHCEMGASRSPAVAKFLIDHKGYTHRLDPRMVSTFDLHNRWVYRQLFITGTLNL